jgi:HlyD family type I secretion membrane fusion protein
MEKRNPNSPIHSRRSEDVQEILSKPPSSLISWGSGSILLILISLIILSFILKYPESISGEAKLTTSVDPSLIYNTSEGYLEKLFVSEDSIVYKGQVLGEIKNSLLSENVGFLDKLVKDLINQVSRGQSHLELKKTDLSFGLLQENYNKLLALVHEYNQLRSNYQIQMLQRLGEKISSLRSLSIVLNEKLQIGEREFQNATIQYKIDEKLYIENVIAKSDWIVKTSSFHQKQSELNNLKQALIQNELQTKETENQLAEIRNKNFEDKEKNKNEITLTLASIENYKLDWKQKYTLVAPIDGKINFIKKISSGDFIKTNQPIAFIVPENKDVKAKVKIPYKGFGKVRFGQKVRITLDSYPYQEFGYLSGKVIKISDAPSDDNFYEVIVELPDELISSFNRQIIYKPGAVGVAEIVTQDYSVFDRLVFSTRNTLAVLKK